MIVAQLFRGWPDAVPINPQTIRQILIAPEHLARTQTTWRFLVHGMQPIGALLGAPVGLRAALVTSSLIMLTGTTLALLGPTRTLRQLAGRQS